MDWARMHSSIYVISGSIVDSNHDGMRDNDEDYDKCVTRFCYYCLDNT